VGGRHWFQLKTIAPLERAGKTRPTYGRKEGIEGKRGITLDEYKKKHGFEIASIGSSSKPSAGKTARPTSAKIRRRVVQLWKIAHMIHGRRVASN